MPTSLFQYEMLPSTWFYLSSLMLLAIFFRFNRFWSIRNFDILLLILLTPGLLYIAMRREFSGYLWLSAIGTLFFIRLVIDTIMIRRPLLEPNLDPAGLTFACIMSMSFIVPNIIINRGDKMESVRTLRLEQILTMNNEYEKEAKPESAVHVGDTPGYRPFLYLTEKGNRFFAPSVSFWKENMIKNAPVQENRERRFISIWQSPRTATAGAHEYQTNSSSPDKQPSLDKVEKTVPDSNPLTFESILLIIVVILFQIGIVLSIIMIGHCHFGNIKTGMAAAMFYLLHPYINQFSGGLDHIVPGFLIILAVLLYRRPMISGWCLGLAGSLVFFPFFLLPLWISFYWKKGGMRFLTGAVSAILVMGLLLLFMPTSLGTYGQQLASMFGWHSMFLVVPDGLWEYIPTFYRIPIIALYMVFCLGFFLWPPRKDLATLIAGTALLMLGTQFWMGNQGGLYIAWYMPLLILAIFRPNLEDRVAESTVADI